MIQRLAVRRDRCFFWATHTGAELDLLVTRGRAPRGFEFKRTTTPKMTRSIHFPTNDLKLKSRDVVHAGDHTFPLASNVRARASKEKGGGPSPPEQERPPPEVRDSW